MRNPENATKICNRKTHLSWNSNQPHAFCYCLCSIDSDANDHHCEQTTLVAVLLFVWHILVVLADFIWLLKHTIQVTTVIPSARTKAWNFLWNFIRFVFNVHELQETSRLSWERTTAYTGSNNSIVKAILKTLHSVIVISCITASFDQ